MMICDLCGKTGIRWMGRFSNLTHTECPHCGGTNCQRAAVVYCEYCNGEGVTDANGDIPCDHCHGTGRISD